MYYNYISKYTQKKIEEEFISRPVTFKSYNWPKPKNKTNYKTIHLMRCISIACNFKNIYINITQVMIVCVCVCMYLCLAFSCISSLYALHFQLSKAKPSKLRI